MVKIKNILLYFSSCLLLMMFKINNVLAADYKNSSECDTIFGKPGEEGTLLELIQSVLNIFRIAAPILVILLGTVDLFTAMISSSEDKMKKAQTNFVKRIIMGVCLIFVPTIINFIIAAASEAITGLDSCMYKW